MLLVVHTGKGGHDVRDTLENVHRGLQRPKYNRIQKFQNFRCMQNNAIMK